MASLWIDELNRKERNQLCLVMVADKSQLLSQEGLTGYPDLVEVGCDSQPG